jgi:serine/threonine protein phosphatase PrpC
MRIECLSIAGSGGRPNEDAYAVNESQCVYAVIDGVSSLVPYTDEAGMTGGAIAARVVKEHLQRLPADSDLLDALLAANACLRERMQSEQVDLSRKEALWGAAVASVRIGEKEIRYAQTGDCMLFAVYADDTVRALTHPQVKHLEERAFRKWEEGIQAGMRTRAELIDYVRDILIDNRYQANTDGGYGVLNGDPACRDFLEYGKINRTGVKAVVLVTDGLLWPTARGEAWTGWEATVLPIVKKGLQAYADDLLALENGDPECIAYPRFKKSDDKTGMVIYLSSSR